MDNQKDGWQSVMSLMDDHLQDKQVELGHYIGYWFRKTPRRMLYYLSYYKFAAKMIGSGKRLLDIGCNEGMGTWLLHKECGPAHGLDIDPDAIAIAQRNWQEFEGIDFDSADFMTYQADQPYDAIVSFDVIEHILPEKIDLWWNAINHNLTDNGVVILGTPSLTSQQYASEVSKVGHVNVYSAERLEAEMSKHFHHVFMFAANDEVVHTGFMPMAHYMIAVGCKKRV